MDRLNDRVRCCRQKAVDEMRAGDRLRFGATIALELGPDAGEGEQRPVIIEREPDDVLLQMTIQKVKSVRALDKAPNSKTRRRDPAGFGWFGDGKGLSPGQNYRSSPRRSSRARRHEVKSIKDGCKPSNDPRPRSDPGPFFVHQTLAVSYRAAGWDA